MKEKEKKPEKKPEKKELPAPQEAQPVEPFDPTEYGFTIPRNFEAQRKRVIDLQDLGEDGDKNIAVVLSAWKDRQLHVADGFEKFELWAAQPSVVHFAERTTRNLIHLIDIWKEFVEGIGIDKAMFKKLGNSHVQQLYRAKASNALTAGKIRSLLPLADRTDTHFLTIDQFKKKIDSMLGVAAGETGLVLKTYVLKPESGAAQEVIESCLQTLKGHATLGDFSQSQILEKALVEFTSNHAGDSGKVRFLTFQAAWNLVASLCPLGVAPVIVVTDLEKAKEAGLGPVESKLVKSAFMGFPGYDTKTVLSTNKKRAAGMIGVDEKQVREYPLDIDTGLLPKMLSKHWEPSSIGGVEKAEEAPAEAVEAPEPTAPPIMPIEELLKLDKEGVHDYASARGIGFSKKAKRETMLKTLLTDKDWYGLKDDEADAKINGEAPKEAVEAPPEEAPEQAPEPPKASPVVEVQGNEKLVRDNLKILRQAKAVDRENFAEMYNSLPKNLSEAEKNEKLLAWTRKIGAERGIKVM